MIELSALRSAPNERNVNENALGKRFRRTYKLVCTSEPVLYFRVTLLLLVMSVLDNDQNGFGYQRFRNPTEFMCGRAILRHK